MAMNEPANSLIGVVDGAIDKSTYISWDVNKIGGSAVWIRNDVPHPSCKACQHLLTLVTQLYCPLEGSPFHRTIYVFMCASQACVQQNSVSFRVFRAQQLADNGAQDQRQSSSHKTQEPVKESMPFDTDWCDDADNWGDDDEDDNGWGDPVAISDSTSANSHQSSSLGHEDANQLSQASVLANDSQAPALAATPNDLVHKLENMSIESRRQASHMSSNPTGEERHTEQCAQISEGVGPRLKSFFINVFDEPSSSTEEMLSHELQLMKEYQQREGVSLEEWDEAPTGGRGGSARGEGYEKATAKHGDRTFQKFAKKIQLCPQQCIRYSYNGAPLWLTQPSQDQTKAPCCQYCGSRRVFEFQLMPALMAYLQFEDENAVPIEFGVVVVYTCSRSCWSDDSAEFFREEMVTIQHDPDSAAVNQAQKHISDMPQTG